MFGLMRAKKCGMSDEEKRFRRLNYCGTCKTIGRLYGSKSRFLLNHDTVFLAELLSALSGEDPADWTKAYQSFNCLRLPASEMPFSLEFAATANLILTEFKIADHVADEKKRRYRFARKAFSKEFKKAAARLEAWNFPLAEVETVLATQDAREASEKSLDALAFPTAQTTALFFREGVRGIGRAELAETAFALGFAFGWLVYLVDAFEDYEKDFRAGKFNAFRAAFDLTEAKLPPEARQLSDIVASSCERVRSVVVLLNKMDNAPAMLKLCREIDQLESDADRAMRNGITGLFSPEAVQADVDKERRMSRFERSSVRDALIAIREHRGTPLAVRSQFATQCMAYKRRPAGRATASGPDRYAVAEAERTSLQASARAHREAQWRARRAEAEWRALNR